MGVIECAKHDLMEPYPVYFEKEGEYVAEFKFTVLLMPNSTMKITGLPLEFDSYQTENSITDETLKVLIYYFDLFIFFFNFFMNLLKNLLALSLTQKKKKKKKTGAKKSGAAGANPADDEESGDEEVKK